MAVVPTYYPLTLGQQIMYVAQKYSLKKSTVNICAMFHFDQEMDRNLLLQAFSLGMLRNESSRVRLHKEGKEVKQYLSDLAPEPIAVMDYSGKTEAELTADLNKWSRTPFPHGSMDTQLYSARLIREPNGFWGAYFCVSHLAFDAYTLMYTASDIAMIYDALKNGTAIPPKKDGYLDLCKKDWEYQASDKPGKELAYWRDEVFGEEPLFSSVTGQPPRKGSRQGKAVDLLHPDTYAVDCKLPAALAQRVDAYAAEHRISPQSLYLLAARSYLSKLHGGQEDITVCNQVARRATLQEKRAGGTRVLSLYLQMKFANSLTISQALKEVSQHSMQCYAHPNMIFTDICDALYEKYGITKTRGPFDCYHSLSFTYNPFRVRLPEGMKAHLTTYCNGASSTPIYLSIMALDDSGDLTFNYGCMKVFTQPDTAEKLHAHILKALKAIVSGEDMPVGRLAEL